MPKQIIAKTKPTKRSVARYLKTLTKPIRQQEAELLLKIFSKVTRTKPVLWSNNMIGFGTYEYTRSNGDYGTWIATGFSVKDSGITLYIMPGYTDHSALLEKLGSPKTGQSCVYLKSLDNMPPQTISNLIKAGLKDLRKNHTVTM